MSLAASHFARRGRKGCHAWQGRPAIARILRNFGRLTLAVQAHYCALRIAILRHLWKMDAALIGADRAAPRNLVPLPQSVMEQSVALW